jgi:resuscitation-promoting factor RpfB
VPGPSTVWSIVLSFSTARSTVTSTVRSGLNGRSGRIAAQAGVLLAVVGGTVAYTGHSSTLTLLVDGRLREVRADARNVRALLADQQVPVSDLDLVSPSLDSPVADGEQVVVRFARPLTVTVDGVPHTYWTTELTLDAALRSLGIRADGARLSASRSLPLGRSGLALDLSTPKSVSVATDGSTRRMVTTAATVADLLAEQRIVLGPLDTVSPVPVAPVVDGLVVAVTRIEHRQVTALEPIRAPLTQVSAPTLSAGKRVLVSAGTPGARRTVYDVTLTNGKEAGRDVVTSVISSQPVPGVVKVGAAPKATPAPDPTPTTDPGPTSAPSGSSSPPSPSAAPSSPPTTAAPSTSTGTKADSLNWAALARCESGGNPRAVNPSGYYGLYQFSLATWHSVGGTGNPINASPAEQLKRAKILYNKAGAGQWSCGHHLFD